MATITSRPQKTINGYVSKWNAGGGLLPVMYTIESDLWPTNSVDDVNTVSSVTNNNGYAQLNLSSTYETYTAGNYVKSTVAGYEGVFKIRSMGISTQIVLDTPFVATGTGTVQKYAYGYYIEVAVFVGIDPTHPLGTGFVNVANIQAVPDANNIARVDIRQVIQTVFSNEFEYTSGNDINLWADFYIDFREVQILNGAQSFGEWETDIANILHAANNTLQLGNSYGGNLYAYVCDEDKPQGKWLTNFEKLYWKDLRYMETSILVNVDTFNLEIIEYDANNDVVGTQLIPYDEGYGIYRINFGSLFFATETVCFSMQLKTTYETISELLLVDYDVVCLDLVPPNSVVLTGLAEIGQNELFWSDTNDGEAAYQVWRYVGSGSVPLSSFTLLDTTTQGSTYYLDDTVSGGITYQYFVVAIRFGNKSGASNILELTPVEFLIDYDPNNE